MALRLAQMKRHTYGSHFAMQGVVLKRIQELMGQAMIEMAMRYVHLSSEARESAVQELDQLIPSRAPPWARDARGAHGGI